MVPGLQSVTTRGRRRKQTLDSSGCLERAALIPGGLSDGQFYSPPESEAGSENEAEEKQDSEKPLLEL